MTGRSRQTPGSIENAPGSQRAGRADRTPGRRRARKRFPPWATFRRRPGGGIVVPMAARAPEQREPSADPVLVTVDDVREARERIAGVLRPTPAAASETLSRLAGRSIVLKPEHLQRTGSFKIRGA